MFTTDYVLLKCPHARCTLPPYNLWQEMNIEYNLAGLFVNTNSLWPLLLSFLIANHGLPPVLICGIMQWFDVL